MKETDYFYWRNEQGTPERHHINEWKVLFETEQTERISVEANKNVGTAQKQEEHP